MYRHKARGVTDCVVKMSTALHSLYCWKSSDLSARLSSALSRTNCFGHLLVLGVIYWYDVQSGLNVNAEYRGKLDVRSVP